MNENKKGTGTKPAPNTTNDSNKIVDTCLYISIISMIIFMIASLYHIDALSFVACGAMFASAIPVTRDNLSK